VGLSLGFAGCRLDRLGRGAALEIKAEDAGEIRGVEHFAGARSRHGENSLSGWWHGGNNKLGGDGIAGGIALSAFFPIFFGRSRIVIHSIGTANGALEISLKGT
jgi:hypothetical protein